MEKKINSMEELLAFKEIIPKHVMDDVLKRISDWMESEFSSMEDDYIKRQFRYAEHFVK